MLEVNPVKMNEANQHHRVVLSPLTTSPNLWNLPLLLPSSTHPTATRSLLLFAGTWEVDEKRWLYSVNIKQNLSLSAFCTLMKTKIKIRPWSDLVMIQVLAAGRISTADTCQHIFECIKPLNSLCTNYVLSMIKLLLFIWSEKYLSFLMPSNTVWILNTSYSDEYLLLMYSAAVLQKLFNC